jgi:hypothetical protein
MNKISRIFTVEAFACSPIPDCRTRACHERVTIAWASDSIFARARELHMDRQPVKDWGVLKRHEQHLQVWRRHVQRLHAARCAGERQASFRCLQTLRLAFGTWAVALEWDRAVERKVQASGRYRMQRRQKTALAMWMAATRMAKEMKEVATRHWGSTVMKAWSQTVRF